MPQSQSLLQVHQNKLCHSRVAARLSTITTTTNRHCFSSAAGDDSGGGEEERHIVLEHVSDNENVPGGVVSILTLNRPRAANAMNRTMLDQLEESLIALEMGNDGTRCVVLTSSSSRVFSAGADLKERRNMTPTQAHDFVSRLRQTMHRVACLPMPVIAAISGTAVGGGLELALCADIRIASTTAKLGLVETSLGIIPGAGGTQRLPRVVGISKAKQMIFSAQKLSAHDALDCGLVDHVVDTIPLPDDGGSTVSPVLEKALEVAWNMARNGPVALRAAKQAIDQGMFATTMQQALDVEKSCYTKILETEDRLEGLKAFAEKRTPNFKGS